jgi:hypothetical protein
MSENIYIQRYNGQEWNDVGLGLSGAGIIPYEFKVHNNELYVCGKFDYAGGVPAKKIAKWDGDIWCGLGGNFTNYTISAIEFYRDTLYVACGDSVDGIQVGGLAKWVGGNYVDTCSAPQSIEEIINMGKEIIIYPNPTNGIFNITFNTKTPSDLKITIYNTNGCKLFEKQFYKTNLIIIDDIQFEKGIFFVKIENDDFCRIKKLIIN